MVSTMQGPPVRLEARINPTRFIHPSPLYKIRRAHRVDQLFRLRTARSGSHSKSSTANGIMPEAHFYHICQMQTFQNSRVAHLYFSGGSIGFWIGFWGFWTPNFLGTL